VFLEKVRDMHGIAVIARSFRELDAALRREGYSDEDCPLFERGGIADGNDNG
jgi:hypothetical protein